ncbi:hypothetical protein FS837_003630 [Tulasnella sp. UAMH 9824]|nr:hypothetical protein FS837_003630 [Tulasnella sp. UAMH 9824]
MAANAEIRIDEPSANRYAPPTKPKSMMSQKAIWKAMRVKQRLLRSAVKRVLSPMTKYVRSARETFVEHLGEGANLRS